MKGFFIVAVVLAALAAPWMSHADTIMFQEGVNGYSGCADSHFHYGGYSAGRNQNYGDSRNILFGYESYQGG